MAKRTISPEHGSAQEKSSFRKLKVRSGSYPHQFTGKNRFNVPKPVPWVEIKGYWLEQAGFTIGSHLSVRVEKGCLILKVQSSPTE